MMYFKSVTAKGIMRYIAFVSPDEKQVAEEYCSIGTSDWFGIVNVYLVSCCSR